MKKIFTFLVVLASALSVFSQGSKAGGLLGRTTSATEQNLVEVVAAGDQASVFTSSPVCYIPCGTLEKYEASAWVNQVSEFVVEECDDAGVGGGKSVITYTSTDGNTVTPEAGAFGGANIVSNTYADGVGTIAFDEAQFKNHLVFAKYLFARGEFLKALDDAHAFHKIDVGAFGNGDVSTMYAIRGVSHYKQVARKSEVLWIVGSERHVYALASFDHNRVLQKIAVEADGVVRGQRTDEGILQE